MYKISAILEYYLKFLIRIRTRTAHIITDWHILVYQSLITKWMEILASLRSFEIFEIIWKGRWSHTIHFSFFSCFLFAIPLRFTFISYCVFIQVIPAPLNISLDLPTPKILGAILRYFHPHTNPQTEPCRRSMHTWSNRALSIL